ncbi:MAG: dihydroorotate dehydrogenase [Acidimicrobiales bacterium]
MNNPFNRRPVDMTTQVGSLILQNPVLTASGTAGHGTEMAGYLDYAALGAFVTKSLAAYPWKGNPGPRLRETPSGLLNSVGLQGPGVENWRLDELPKLRDRGATVVASIWGTTVEQFARAAQMLAGAEGVVAIEVNVSCPNLEDRSRMFAHSRSATSEAVSASRTAGLPVWVKLSPNVADLVEIAAAGLSAGAEALVLINTLLGMSIDAPNSTYRLGSGRSGGGLSGPAIRPIALRAVHDCREAFPRAASGPGGLPVSIVGVGGISSGLDAVEMMLAGADAVEVGTASFRDPRAPMKVIAQMRKWCQGHNVHRARDLVAGVHSGKGFAESLSQVQHQEQPEHQEQSAHQEHQEHQTLRHQTVQESEQP